MLWFILWKIGLILHIVKLMWIFSVKCLIGIICLLQHLHGSNIAKVMIFLYNPKHKECLDNILTKMVDDLVEYISHIPKTKTSTCNNTLPWWFEHVKLYNDDAIFCKSQ